VSATTSLLLQILIATAHASPLPLRPVHDLTPLRASLVSRLRTTAQWKHGPLMGAAAGVGGTALLGFFCRCGASTFVPIGLGAAAVGALSGFLIDGLFDQQPRDYRYEGAVVGGGVGAALGITTGLFICALSEAPDFNCPLTMLYGTVVVTGMAGVTGGLVGGALPRTGGIPTTRPRGESPP
jgi:hypothetical protein